MLQQKWLMHTWGAVLMENREKLLGNSVNLEKELRRLVLGVSVDLRTWRVLSFLMGMLCLPINQILLMVKCINYDYLS